VLLLLELRTKSAVDKEGGDGGKAPSERLELPTC